LHPDSGGPAKTKNGVGAKVKMLSFYILAEDNDLEYTQFFEAGLLHTATVTEFGWYVSRNLVEDVAGRVRQVYRKAMY